MPSEGNADVLKKRATRYMMKFLVQHFPDLANLHQYFPDEEMIHPVQCANVVPMTVLFKDENYTVETIDILAQLAEDGKLNGDPQVS